MLTILQVCTIYIHLLNNNSDRSKLLAKSHDISLPNDRWTYSTNNAYIFEHLERLL